MIVTDSIEPIQTEWSSLIVFVPKNGVTLHSFIDSWKLNAVTILDLYPILHIDRCIDLLGHATKVSALDANNRYWQCENFTDNQEETIFTSHPIVSALYE